jgi:hypothetical protein
MKSISANPEHRQEDGGKIMRTWIIITPAMLVLSACSPSSNSPSSAVTSECCIVSEGDAGVCLCATGSASSAAGAAAISTVVTGSTCQVTLTSATLDGSPGESETFQGTPPTSAAQCADSLPL